MKIKLIVIILAFLLTSIPHPSFAAKASVKNDYDNEDDFSFYEEENVVKIYDPLEKMNRKIFTFNDIVDRCCVEHIALVYRQGVPPKARNMIHNFLNNLSRPISAVNSFLQGKTENGLATFSNFLINTTIGIGGIFDLASERGILYQQEDFGQTLGHYGVHSGAYLMLPILGPSSARDLGGMAVDKTVNFTDLNMLKIGGETDAIPTEYRIGAATTSGIDKRESLIEIVDDIRKDSFDPYATIRSAYLQKRATEIKK